MQLELSRESDRFLARIPKKHAGQITRKIDTLLIDSYPPDSKPLAGFSVPLFRVDSGEYRIAYLVVGNTLFIPLVGKRNDDDIYRKLKRMFE